ncbi:MAG: hypothetical protein PHH92_09630 [Aliarcobacter skirrowii]|uniref:hypothetical protein n=1 Tax=Aliarcobacter skirrowii TaxID=28200 RepID=UPI00242F3858|nr:hypothetical protein [Aliarcobacter skirrowii]MCK9428263.1 hypothetical protein [Acholeplasmataceae bacterium]MDD3497630.1 hypothetical protein [Aliarcobacter skirrowii]
MREMTETQLSKEIEEYRPFAINRAKEIIKETTGREPQDVDEINAIAENLIDGYATKIKNLYKIKKGE